ncbi:MAG: glycosyltransferase family 4 protein [Desulfovibrionaceae bacterium]
MPRQRTENPARIAILNPRLSRYGGAEGFAWRLAEALARAGYRVDFICGRSEAAPPEGVRPVVVGRFGPFRWMKLLWFALAAERARRRGGYDLTIGLGKTFTQDVMRVGGGPLPVFWRLSKLAWEPGMPRILKMLRRRLNPANWVGWWIERVQARTTPVIVANSYLSRQWIVEAHPHLDPAAIRVIFNRPDLSRFSPLPREARAELRAAAGIREGERAVLTAGTNFALKGVATLIRALARLPERYRLFVAGDRNPDACLSLARKLGVEGRVTFLGRVNDMRAFYNAGDVFVLPTFYDASSNAVMEALACGIKTISSRCNGSAHFLPGDRILSDPAADGELADMLLRLEDEPAPGPFEWPGEVRSGMGAWIDLIAGLVKHS